MNNGHGAGMKTKAGEGLGGRDPGTTAKASVGPGVDQIPIF